MWECGGGEHGEGGKGKVTGMVSQCALCIYLIKELVKLDGLGRANGKLSCVRAVHIDTDGTLEVGCGCSLGGRNLVHFSAHH